MFAIRVLSLFTVAKCIISVSNLAYAEQDIKISRNETDPDLPTEDITQHKNWHLLNDEDCGLSVTDRIVGGKNASLGQYPWVARIGYAKDIIYPDDYDYSDMEYLENNKILAFECGGALISDLYVITAAHCVVGLPSTSTLDRVRLGEYNDLTEIDCDDDGNCADPVQDFKPTKILPHPEYRDELFKHDVALIKLDRRYEDNGWVSPICTISGELINKNYIGQFAEVTGWGYMDRDNEQVAHILQTIQLPIVDDKQCNEAYRRTTTIGISQWCVGGEENRDSCGGDSGGPLQKVDFLGDEPPRYYLIGVVSFGSKYCGSKKPAVYTRIANFLPWILDNLN